MKTYLATLVFCLTASISAAQLLQNPDAEQPAAEKDKEKAVAGDRAVGKGGPADRRGPGGRVGNGGPAGQGGPAAMHGPMGPLSNPLFEAIDTDGDGVISRKELRNAVAQLKKLDTDNDGNITLAEAAPAGGPVGPMGPGGPGAAFGDPNEMINRLMQNDKNGDGKLTADELPGPMAQQMIQNGDKDGDGALSKDELTQAMHDMQNRMANGPGGFRGGAGNFPGGPGGFPGGPGGAQNQMMGQMMQWDRNHDGVLSTNEVPNSFRVGDLNNDGQLDPMEMRMLIERYGERLRGAMGRGLNNNTGSDGKTNSDGKKR